MMLRIVDVAKMHCVSRQTAWEWVKKGYLPAERVGHQWRVTELAARTFEPPRCGRPVVRPLRRDYERV